jgi:hypothetical protein
LSEWGDPGSSGHRGRRQLFSAQATFYHRNALMSRGSYPATQEILSPNPRGSVSHLVGNGIVQLRHALMPADGLLAASSPTPFRS